jgi:hypothetical protein
VIVFSLRNQIIQIFCKILKWIDLPLDIIEDSIKPIVFEGIRTHLSYEIDANCRLNATKNAIVPVINWQIKLAERDWTTSTKVKYIILKPYLGLILKRWKQLPTLKNNWPLYGCWKVYLLTLLNTSSFTVWLRIFARFWLISIKIRCRMLAGVINWIAEDKAWLMVWTFSSDSSGSIRFRLNGLVIIILGSGSAANIHSVCEPFLSEPIFEI